jgi:hypothetical protein
MKFSKILLVKYFAFIQLHCTLLLTFGFTFGAFKKIAKFWFRSNRFEILTFQIWQWRMLKKLKLQLPKHK